MTKKFTFATKCTILLVSLILVVTLASSIYLMCVKLQTAVAYTTGAAKLSLQQHLIREDFENVYSFDNYLIKPTEDGTVVILINSNDGSCVSMKCYFDKDLNYIDSVYEKPEIIDDAKWYITALISIGVISSVVIVIFKKKLFD